MASAAWRFSLRFSLGLGFVLLLAFASPAWGSVRYWTVRYAQLEVRRHNPHRGLTITTVTCSGDSGRPKMIRHVATYASFRCGIAASFPVTPLQAAVKADKAAYQTAVAGGDETNIAAAKDKLLNDEGKLAQAEAHGATDQADISIVPVSATRYRITQCSPLRPYLNNPLCPAALRG